MTMITAAKNQPEHAVGVVDLEIIEVQSRGEEGEFSLPNFVSAPLLGAVHVQIPGGAAVFIAQHDFHPLGAHRGGNVHVQRTHLPRDQGAEGGFELGLLAVE